MKHYLSITWMILLYLVWGTAHSEVYKWVDEQGRVHYTSKPPAQSNDKSSQAKRLDIKKPSFQSGLRTQRNSALQATKERSSLVTEALASKNSNALQLIRQQETRVTISDLAFAIKHAHNQALEEMLTKVASASSTAPEYLKLIDNNSLLDIAAVKGNLEAVTILMKKDPVRFRTPELSLTALIKAIQSNNSQIVNTLISHGVNVNDSNSLALKKASELGLINIATILLRNYAEVNPPLNKSASKLGRIKDVSLSPLSLAVKNNQFGMVKLLVESGAEINAQHSSYGTAFDIAKKQKNETILRYLTLRGAKSSKDSLRGKSFY
ncbi:MAG: ankyrin repeat domain-containing protein [Pseudomonadota bacterium]